MLFFLLNFAHKRAKRHAFHTTVYIFIWYFFFFYFFRDRNNQLVEGSATKCYTGVSAVRSQNFVVFWTHQWQLKMFYNDFALIHFQECDRLVIFQIHVSNPNGKWYTLSNGLNYFHLQLIEKSYTQFSTERSCISEKSLNL